MSEKTVTEEKPAEHLHEGPEHPSDWVYIKVAIVLAVLTSLEITVSYIKGLRGPAQDTMLITLAAIKFTIVAMFFMHLKFDQPVLRRIFVAGIILALVIYSIYLASLGVFAR